MSDKIIVQPRTVDGVEFYVSDLTDETGMSISGLARLSGVTAGSALELLRKMDEGQTSDKTLNSFAGKVFNIRLKPENAGIEARIVTSEACAEVIVYYAFRSAKGKNAVAQHTAGKFIGKGINLWIREVTGAVQKHDNLALMSAMQEILGQLHSLNHKVERLEATATKYENIRSATITNFPRLDEMLEGLESNDRILPQADDELTLTQWLATKGITFDPSTKMRFGNLVSNTFQCMTGDRPKKARCKDKNGNYTEKQNVYAPCHFPILEIALKQMF